MLRILEDQTYLLTEGLHIRTRVGRIDAGNTHLAAGRSQQGIEVLDQCRLPRSGRSDEADELSGLDGEGHILEGHRLQRGPLQIDMGEVTALNERHRQPSPARGGPMGPTTPPAWMEGPTPGRPPPPRGPPFRKTGVR